MILAIRTDNPDAELYLCAMDGSVISSKVWHAHRTLAETLHVEISTLLDASNTSLSQIKKIAFFQGPGSFTGLRIGASLANALAYALSIPIVGSTGEHWMGNCATATLDSFFPVQLLYGQNPHITQQKK